MTEIEISELGKELKPLFDKLKHTQNNYNLMLTSILVKDVARIISKREMKARIEELNRLFINLIGNRINLSIVDLQERIAELEKKLK